MEPRNPRRPSILVACDILNGRSDGEGFAFLGVDVDVIDNKTVGLAEDSAFGRIHGDVTERDVLDLHLR